MPKSEATIQEYMTAPSHSIDAGHSLQEATKMMLSFKIRHLPVTKDGELFGIVSERDIKVAIGFFEGDAKLIGVGDICKEKLYTVEPTAKMHEVLDEMAQNQYGAAVVVQNKKLIGIFTSGDACRFLSKMLQQHSREGS